MQDQVKIFLNGVSPTDEHKNNAFTKTSKHIKFYTSVVNNTWNVFTLDILDLTPNHVEIFSRLNPNHILTKIEYDSLQDLTLYELTIAEQIYLDAYKPTLNGSLYANWSSYNIGATDYIRSEESNQNLSFSNLNRSFNQATIDLHKSNRLGTKASEATKLKMSASHKGRPVTLIDVNTGNEIIFDTVSSLRREIGISERTINRWALNGKVHKTNSLKYPLIRIKIQSCLSAQKQFQYKIIYLGLIVCNQPFKYSYLIINSKINS